MEYNNLVFKEKDGKEEIKSREIFNNLKADYFLQKVFYNLKRKTLLNIVKYNKNIKKRININTYNYREYSEKLKEII